MLEIRNLSSGYNKMQILQEVNLKVNPKEIVAIIGPNGAGKSTIIKSIYNLTQIFSGDIIFQGKNITGTPTHKLHQTGVGYLNQGRVVFSNLTIEENLRLAVSLHIKDNGKIDEEVELIYQFFPILRGKREEYAYTLSGGQQQQLALGRALIQHPSLLLLDEPTLGLSPNLQKDFFEKINELKESGISFLIVEQNAKSAIHLADRTYLLESGQVVLEGGKDILQNPMIKKTYLGQE